MKRAGSLHFVLDSEHHFTSLYLHDIFLLFFSFASLTPPSCCYIKHIVVLSDRKQVFVLLAHQ